MDNAVGWDTARMGRYFILSEVVYDKGLQAAYAAVEARSPHTGCKGETARDALERMKEAYGSLDAIPPEATSDDIRDMIRSMQETQDGGYLPVDCDEILEKRRHGMSMDKL